MSEQSKPRKRRPPPWLRPKDKLPSMPPPTRGTGSSSPPAAPASPVILTVWHADPRVHNAILQSLGMLGLLGNGQGPNIEKDPLGYISGVCGAAAGFLVMVPAVTQAMDLAHPGFNPEQRARWITDALADMFVVDGDEIFASLKFNTVAECSAPAVPPGPPRDPNAN